MVEQILFAPGGATEVKQDALLAELVQKLEAGQEVALTAGTLAALESINATVTGTVALDGPTLAALENISAVVSGTVAVSNFPASQPVSGTVALDSTTLAALETINALVSGTVALDATTLAALESITVAGTVALDSTTLAALENVTATVSGTVALDASTLTALENIGVTGTVALDAPTLAALETITAVISGSVAVTGPLTDAELRATPIPVSGTFTSSGLTDTQLRAADVNVADSGEREYTHVVASVTASGDTTVYTPAAGKRVRLHWIYAINDPVSTTAPLIKVKLGASEKYRVYALSKRQLVTGPTDGALVVNLGVAGNVAVTALLEEVT